MLEIGSIVAWLSRLAATYIFLRFLLWYTHDNREPKAIATEIPFLSPLIGMAKKTKFYTDLRDEYNLPIYTLRLPGSRIYVVNSTNLIPAIQRQVRTLDFTPVQTRAVVNVMGATPTSRKILESNRNGVGEYSYAIEFDKVIHPAVTSGANLDAMTKLSIHRVSEFLHKETTSTPKVSNLYEWVHKNLAWATTEAVYGPENPFRDPEIMTAFWEFEKGIVILLLRLFPSIFARKSIRAREKVVRAFETYFSNRGYEKGSALIRARYDHSIDYNIALEDIARFEVGGAVAVLANTIPTSFWVLWHLVSDTTALESCRDELLKLCQVDKDSVTLDITRVKTACPILLSTLQEVLRYHGTGISVRLVQEDHLLDNQYLLKKGNTLMIPGPVQHTSKQIYGDDVAEFNHKRFIRTGAKGLNPVDFRGFGGGSTLCPGRHFASTEIIAFFALTILQFDSRPVSGEWICPTTDKAGMQAAVPPPDVDVKVNITVREGVLAGKKWNVLVTSSDRAVSIVAEDEVKSP